MQTTAAYSQTVVLALHIAHWNWTAIGTLVLAAVTTFLALETWRLAKASRADLVESQRQSDIAQRTLLSQSEPMILDMAVSREVLDVPMFQVTNCPDDEPARGAVLVLTEPGAVCSIPFVNVGRGPAIFGASKVFLPDEGGGFFEATPRFMEIERRNLPRGESTRLNLEFLGGELGWSDWHRVVGKKESFWVQIQFEDITGSINEAMWFFIGPTPNPRAREEWSVVRTVINE